MFVRVCDKVALAPDATTGGVDDPSLDGIEIEDTDDVEETGDGTAIALIGTPLLAAVSVFELGTSKFDIVGECFLTLLVPLAATIDGFDGRGTIDCLKVAGEDDVEVFVLVAGVFVETAESFPFEIVPAFSWN